VRSAPRYWQAAALALLLLAALLRLWAWQDAPPGLQHDEVYYAHDGMLTATEGQWQLYYPANQGREGAYIWLMAASYAAFGENWVMAKFPPLALGLLTIALMLAALRRWHGPQVALLASTLLVVSFWGLFVGRVSLRAVSLPACALLLAWAVHRLAYARRGRAFWVGLGGLALGGAVYTYTSAPILFAAYGLLALGLGLRQRALWRPLLLLGLIGGPLALPMAITRLNNPDSLERVEKVTRPWNNFLAGQPQELIDNAWNLAGLLALTGDPEWRYNQAGRPLFPMPVGLLAYAGLALALGRALRQPIYGYWLGLALLGLLPSLLSVAAPSFLRSILALIPAAYLFVALALETLGRTLRRPALGAALGLACLAWVALADWPAYFRDWANHAEVLAIYRDDLQQLAADLRQRGASRALVSAPNVELDALTYRYSSPPPATLSFFSGATTLLLSDQPALLYISALAPITPPHLPWLSQASGTQSLGQVIGQNGQPLFEVYALNALGRSSARLAQQQHPLYLAPQRPDIGADYATWASPAAYPINFGNQLSLLGLELPREAIATREDGVNLQLIFHPLVDGSPAPLLAFAHLSSTDGVLLAQRDLMGVAPSQWRRDTFFIQDTFIVAGDQDAGVGIVTIGVYNWQTGERLPILDAQGQVVADRLIVGAVRLLDQPPP